VSKTQFVGFGEEGFWAYDVALGIFLKHLIDAADASGQADAPWLSEAVSSWRVTACISDYGLTLTADWSTAQWKTFLILVEEACARLAARESIPAGEIVDWQILEGTCLHTRGAPEVHTAPIVELGQAIIALVSGRLQAAPKGKIWLYGTPSGRETLGWEG